MANKALKSLSLLTVAATLASTIMPLLSSSAYAATIADVKVALAPETASTASVATVTFTTAGTLEIGDTVEITYDSAAFLGAIVAADVTAMANTSKTTVSAGYIKLTATAQIVGGAQTVVIGLLNTLTNPVQGNYNFSVTTAVAVTGAVIDYGAGLAYVGHANDVTVDAVVPPVIDMELFLDASHATSDTAKNVCHLGVLSISTIKTCDYYIGTATNNPSGLNIDQKEDHGMYNGNVYLTPASGSAVVAGTEKYGFVMSNPSGALYSAAAGSFTADAGVKTTETIVATTTSVHNSISGADSRLKVMHTATMGLATEVGSYHQVVTYTAYTK